MQKTERFELRLSKKNKVSIKLEANKRDRSMGSYLVWLHNNFVVRRNHAK